MIRPGDIISYLEMYQFLGGMVQKGMNFRLRGRETVVLMSLRKGAPYADRVEDSGKVLIYEGHDAPNRKGGPDPKTVDQPRYNPGGGLTANGLFEEAAKRCKAGTGKVEVIRVFEKIKAGIWVYNGRFRLVDAWQEISDGRKVFKFRMELLETDASEEDVAPQDLRHDRMIPSDVKLTVWKRDGGKCVKCQSKDNLHFDHIVPFSKGGTSLIAENIQLMCARHNLEKRDKIQ